jgi:hypothetical protein
MTATLTHPTDHASDRAAHLGYKWHSIGMQSLYQGQSPRPTITINRKSDPCCSFQYQGSTIAEALTHALDVETAFEADYAKLMGCRVCFGTGTYLTVNGDRTVCRHTLGENPDAC